MLFPDGTGLPAIGWEMGTRPPEFLGYNRYCQRRVHIEAVKALSRARRRASHAAAEFHQAPPPPKILHRRAAAGDQLKFAV
jgi:hypothetical protein